MVGGSQNKDAEQKSPPCLSAASPTPPAGDYGFEKTSEPMDGKVLMALAETG